MPSVDDPVAIRVQPESEAIAHQLLAGELESGLVTFASGDSRYTLLCRTVQVGDGRLVVGEAPGRTPESRKTCSARTMPSPCLPEKLPARTLGSRGALAEAREGSRHPPEQTLGEEFLDAIIATDRRRAADLAIAALQRGVGVEELYVGVLQESLHEVGRRWQSNTITVADEHAAAAVVQLATGCGSSSAGRPRRSSM